MSDSVSSKSLLSNAAASALAPALQKVVQCSACHPPPPPQPTRFPPPPPPPKPPRPPTPQHPPPPPNPPPRTSPLPPRHPPPPPHPRRPPRVSNARRCPIGRIFPGHLMMKQKAWNDM